MSETKTDNKELQQTVESIAKKIHGAPALNGGFDRMLVIVEHIREIQDDTTEKINKIHDDLYEPDDGLYARVKMVETVAADFAKKQAEHLATDEKTLVSLNESLKKLSEKDDDLGKKAETTLRLKKIAGEDLEKLESMIRVKSVWLNVWSKAVWLLGGGILAAIGKTVWELISRK
jgi:hypothetical protein